jgi:hypothetical protein
MMVRTGLARAAFILGLLASSAGLALADGSPDGVAVASGARVSPEEVTMRLQSQGFTVSKIKLDDGRYKVKTVDAAGREHKLTVSPATGAVVSMEEGD